MLFRCLALLVFGSLDAHAVLDAAKASKLDQNSNFAGCPAIGSGASSSNLCKRLKKPEEYCSYYNSNPTLGGTPEVKAAFKACRDFYQAAIEGLRLVCDYEGDSNAVLNTGSKSAANVNGAAAAQGAAASTLACGRKVYFYYADKLNDQSQKLEAMFRAGKSALSTVAKKSGEVVKTEVNCELNGTPGYPPGYMLAGLAAAGLSDQKNTKNNVSIVMAKLGKMINDNVQQAKLYSGRITQNQTGLSTITGGDGIKDLSTEEDVKSGGHESEKGMETTGGGRMINKVFRKVTAGAAKDTAIDSSIHAANGEDAIKFEELLMGSDGLIFRHAAKANMAALLISLAIDAVTGELKKGAVANELAGYGVFVYGSMLGAPALGVALAAEIVLYVGEQIQEHWSEYDKEVTREFQKFAQAHAQQFPQATSAQVAQAYAPEKKEFAYCSKCNLQEQNFGCPGYEGAMHGYNPNFNRGAPPATTAQPFSNPWLAKAYQQYRARATASSQFNGIPSVPPTSKAPQ